MKIILAILSLFVGLKSFAQEQSGSDKAQACLGCHGEKGISPSPLWPNLAGQKDEYIIKQLTAFKSGERKDPMMNPMAANLSEKDIQDLAQFFSTLKN